MLSREAVQEWTRLNSEMLDRAYSSGLSGGYKVREDGQGVYASFNITNLGFPQPEYNFKTIEEGAAFVAGWIARQHVIDEKRDQSK